MKAKTIFLAIVAIAGLAWACSYRIDGLAWFPGFLISVTAAIGAYDSYQKGKSDADNYYQNTNKSLHKNSKYYGNQN